MRAEIAGALTHALERVVSRRHSLTVALAAMTIQDSVPAPLAVEAGKRARKRRRRKRRQRERLCRSVCDGGCAACQDICGASCETGCPRCYHRPGAAPFCGTFTVTHECQFCEASLGCPAQHPHCFTGFTDQASGTTQRFSVCGDYPTGICADFVGCF